MANIIEEYFISMNIKQEKALDGLDKLQKQLDKTKKESARTNKELQSGTDSVADGYRKIRNEIVLLGGAFISISGLKSFFNDAVNSMSQLGYTADTLGITTEKLEALQLASEKLGGSKGGITSFVASLTQSLADLGKGDYSRFLSGGINSFSSAGGKFENLGNTQSALLEIANVYSNLYSTNPSRAYDFAKSFGISEETLPLLRKGREGIQALLDAQAKYTVTSKQDAEKAQAFNRELLNLRDGFVSVGTKIVQALLPSLHLAVLEFEKLSSWFNKHAPGIEKHIGAWIEGFTNFVKTLFSDDQRIEKTLDGWLSRFDKIATAIENIGNLAKGITDVFDFFNPKPRDPSKPKPIRKQATGSLTDDIAGLITNERTSLIGGKLSEAGKIVDFFVKKGWSREQAAGIAANLWSESNFRPGAIGDSGKAYGLGQWHKARANDFKKLFGKDLHGSSMDEQLAFVDWELRNTESKAGNNLKKAANAKQAGSIVSLMYERPKNAIGESISRGYLARKIFADTYSNMNVANAKPTAAGNTTSNSSNVTYNITGNNINVAANDREKMIKSITSPTNAQQVNRGMK